MNLSPEQTKAARALLGWTQEQLAANVGVSLATVSSFEKGSHRPSVLIVSTIRAALESAGVEFANGGQPGVRMKAAAPAKGAISDEAALPDIPKTEPYDGSPV